MKGADYDYDIGIKNQWRRTTWNRIEERLRARPKHPRDALTLYLAGRDDLERGHAKGHGFRDHNLIAIDRDKKVARDLRATGALTVSADALQVLMAWPDDRPVDVVHLDFCAGLEFSTFGLLVVALHRPAFRFAVTSFNFMRGRESDEGSRELRAQLVDIAGQNGKHRGMQFFLWAALPYLEKAIIPNLTKVGTRP